MDVHCSGISTKILWQCLHSGIGMIRHCTGIFHHGKIWDITALALTICEHFARNVQLMCHYVSKLECPRFWNIPVLKYPSAEIFQCQNVPNADQCSGNGPMVQWIPYSWGALGSNIFPISISKTWSASWTKKSGHGISSQNTKTYFFHIIWQKPNKVVQSEVLNSNM